MSRTPVRESLLALRDRGLVRIEPRVGHFATDISATDVFEAYEARLLIEPALAEAAAQRCTAEEVAALREIVGFGVEEISAARFGRAVELNRRFHVGIANASGNRRLAQVFSQLMDDVTRIIHYELAHGLTTGAWRDEHLGILETIARHDGQDASRLVRETILGTTVVVQQGVWLSFRDLLEQDGAKRPGSGHGANATSAPESTSSHGM
jgi:DNA-binding GntR family transcriptional regulator